MGKAPVFKPYDSDQLQLLPPSLEELILGNRPSRIVKKVIDQIDIRPINRKYKGGGASSYHPRMLLKVLVYGYLVNSIQAASSRSRFVRTTTRQETNEIFPAAVSNIK